MNNPKRAMGFFCFLLFFIYQMCRIQDMKCDKMIGDDFFVKTFSNHRGVKFRKPSKEHATNRSFWNEICKRSGKIVVINYANVERYRERQWKSCNSALASGKVDYCLSMGEDFLDENFKTMNRRILNISRGGGYWVWKPYVIFNTLLAMDDGDFLFYLDCDWRILFPVEYYTCIMVSQPATPHLVNTC